ncbi:hypothetical protein QTN25_001559 [Entamoeba marina]
MSGTYLSKKRWNVSNFSNQRKVKEAEENAKEKQRKEEIRKREVKEQKDYIDSIRLAKGEEEANRISRELQTKETKPKKTTTKTSTIKGDIRKKLKEDPLVNSDVLDIEKSLL